jgi:hypothetical protein
MKYWSVVVGVWRHGMARHFAFSLQIPGMNTL